MKIFSNGIQGLQPPGFVEAETVKAAVPLAMAAVLPDSTCVTRKIGNINNNNNISISDNNQAAQAVRGCKQFWKAGDYEGDKDSDENSAFSCVGMDHARIHPKFLHSIATSHKWALGAFAELLDNSLDGVCNGATYVNVDVMKSSWQFQFKPGTCNFKLFRDHGTRIVIYNLWEGDEGQLELDFDTDPHDIQIRGVNQVEKSIQMSKKYPNSRHFLTYRHSLRSYASILYLRLPSPLRIILRGKDAEHHNIVNGMMMKKDLTYTPLYLPEGMPKDSNMVAKVTLGFVKDAKSHIDVQGFNVYHKNRLIKPFWRVWNAAGSDGRGVIGVLEASFVEPAHDKQGFELTGVLQRLEQRMVAMQKNFWSKNCQIVGYAARRRSDFPDKESSVTDKEKLLANQSGGYGCTGGFKTNSSKKLEKGSSSVNASTEDRNCNKALQCFLEPQQDHGSNSRGCHMPTYSHLKVADTNGNGTITTNGSVERSIMLRTDSSIMERLELALNDLNHERDSNKSLKTELEMAKQRMEEMDKEQEALIQILVTERTEREQEERRLWKSLTDASNTIGELLEKVKWLVGRTTVNCKEEKE